MRQCGGSLRHLGNGKVSLCWDADTGIDRCNFVIRLGKAWAKGLARPWAFAGASLSHAKALRTMLPSVDASGDPLSIFEDDAVLSLNLEKKISKIVSALPSGWLIVQLGAQTAGVASSGRRTFRSFQFGKVKQAERCYLAHAYLVSAMGAREVLQKLEAGCSPDGALVAVQGAQCRKKRKTTFYVDPALCSQSSFVSDTCVESDWREALKKKVTCKNIGHKGSGKIRRRALKQMRSDMGRKGGQKKAGGGTSESQMRQKKAKKIKWAS